ncbi:hypothetical protein FQ006_25520, partial [Escherichia coli]|nr:hypothetical protein [Escherichia coli]
GMDTFSFCTATGNPAFQHILLDGLISTPQVLTVILPASWCQNVGKRLVRTVLIFTESSDQLSRATDRVP